MNTNNHDDIDVVIMWVDGSDKEWIAEKNRYLGSTLSVAEVDASANRYRDWDNLQYVFRGIEKNMPWVRKVHLVTNGQYPKWLNLHSKKLNFVKHSDFMPEKYLPTFSANPIELNLHRIEGLAEKFIFFNDDFFVISPTKATDFYRKGLPCDQISLWRALSTSYDDPMPHIMINNAALVNQHFNLIEAIQKNPFKWLSFKNSLTNLALTATLLPVARNKIPALYYHHLPQPFLKTTFEDVWREEGDVLDAVSINRFRSPRDASQGLMKYWQIMSGNISPRNIRRSGHYSNLDLQDLENVNNIIRKQNKQLLCLNDARVEDFHYTKKIVNDAFEYILPEKSEFEK